MNKKIHQHLTMLLPIALVCGCQQQIPAPIPPSVRLGTVSAAEAGSETRYSFSLLPNRQANLGFKSAGIVEQIAETRGADGRMREITMGDPAPAGLRLARVRTADYQHQLETAQQGFAQAKASLASTQASQQLAQVNFDRAANLYREASLTKQNYDQALQQKLAADASVKGAEAAILQNQTSIAQAQLALRDTVINAPFSGVVVSRQIELGDIVASSTTAFQIADIHILKADFTVPDTLLHSVPKGRKILLNLPGAIQPVPATVTAVSPTSDSNSHLFTVEVSLLNQDNRLRPGMIGSLELMQDGSSERVLTAPIESVVHINGGSGFAVYVPRQEGGHTFAKLQPIEIGRGIGRDMEVRSGLTLNQEVITTGAQMLHDNEEIRVVQ
ncbi:efflux RND transporter periplasmic adaptor subunit [Edaphobacter sp. HDX4]|uniref:efflux RND transporter periplasmic adaptor subunit n=1 Tax=Edaphobacter sp. HDX4 TaxID=2794064 RepID=UPI002FE5BB5C